MLRDAEHLQASRSENLRLCFEGVLLFGDADGVHEALPGENGWRDVAATRARIDAFAISGIEPDGHRLFGARAARWRWGRRLPDGPGHDHAASVLAFASAIRRCSVARTFADSVRPASTFDTVGTLTDPRLEVLEASAAMAARVMACFLRSAASRASVRLAWLGFMEAESTRLRTHTSTKKYPDAYSALVVTKISQEDTEVAEAARQHAGGPSALARIFVVSKQAVSGWGRTRPIPRHLRDRLRAFVATPAVPEAEVSMARTFVEDVRVRRAIERLVAPLAAPSALGDLLDLLRADAALDPFAGLPPGYRERYRERVKEVETEIEAQAARLKRNLEEYMQLLLEEAREPKR